MTKRKGLTDIGAGQVADSDQPFHLQDVDAATLKAFAHPLRMRMYNHLKDHGAATASMLAEAMGESTGQTSYHLRQLARHGLIEEDAGRGTARERWWEAKGFSFGLGTYDADPSVLTTMEVVQRGVLEERHRRHLEWIERQADEERAWQEVVSFNEATTTMTPAELKDVVHAVAHLVDDHLERAKEARSRDGGVGARTVKLYGQFFPLPPD